MAYMLRMYGAGAGTPRHSSSLVHSGISAKRLRAPVVLVMAAFAASAMGGCASTQSAVTSTLSPSSKSASSEPMFPELKWGVSASRRVAAQDERIPKGGGTYKVGEPYQVGGRWYNPREQPDYDRIGVASWYGSDFHGRHTSNGEVFDMHALTAAHPTLPLPSYAYVTNLSNSRTILVRVNDRGPYVGERMIDLSKELARSLGLLSGGTGKVRVRYAGPAPLDGNDRRERQFLASRPWTGGADIAALERTESFREWAPNPAPARQDWRPPVNQGGVASIERSPLPEPYRPASLRPSYGQSYADAGSGQGLWSPDTYRASLASR